MKKLYRTKKERILAGVLGGLGVYFNVDPTVLRISFVLIILITGFFPGMIAYIIAIFIIPLEPEKEETETVVDIDVEENKEDK